MVTFRPELTFTSALLVQPAQQSDGGRRRRPTQHHPPYAGTPLCKHTCMQRGPGIPPPSPHQGDRVGVNTGGEKDDTRKRKMRAKVDLAKKKKSGNKEEGWKRTCD